MPISREVLIQHTKELEEVMFRSYPDIITDEGLLRANRERNEALAELCRKQKRALDFMEGKPIEPEVHFGEAVLHGVIAGNAQ
jgi:hypothetical protein